MKKSIFIKALMVMSTLSLCSCGGGSGDDNTSVDSSGETVRVVKVWVHKSSEEPEGKIYNTIKNNFNNSNITTASGQKLRMSVEFYGSTLETKIEGSVLTGGLPDVIAIDSSDITAKANSNIIVDMSDYVSDAEKSSYVDSVIKQGTINNKLYSLSGMEAPGGLYYNQKLLEEVGYTASDFGTLDNPWSWNDVMKAMQKLKEGGKSYQIKMNFGFGEDGYMYLFSPLVYSAGASFGTDDHVTEALTTPEAIAGLKQMEQFYKNNPGWVYSGSSENAFQDEKVAFEIYGPWLARTIKTTESSVKGHYGIMPYPVYESENGTKSSIVSTPCGSYGFAVTKDTKDIEAASLVVKYITGVESSEMLYSGIGTFPTHKSLLSSMEEFQSGPEKSLADYLVANKYTRPKMIKYPQLKKAYGDVLSYIQNMDQVSNYNLESQIRSCMQTVDNARG